MTLHSKVIGSQLLACLAPLAIVGAIVVWSATGALDEARQQTRQGLDDASATARTALLASQEAALQRVASDIELLCQSQQELLEQKLGENLAVARDVLDRLGPISLDAAQPVRWAAVNQLGGERVSVTLPAMRLGEGVVSANDDPGVPSAAVDRVRALVGGTCTLFQRLNDAGDMLRISTNVIGPNGRRAIGTYIPATGLDGGPSAVLAVVLAGNTYTGRAFVVDQWYLASYAPLKDAGGKVIGAIYVGIPEQSAAAVRNGILGVKLGQSGHAFVLEGSGRSRGTYIISRNGRHDGQNILQQRDAEGRPFVQDMLDTAKRLAPGQSTLFRYSAQDGDAVRHSIVALAYFQPWDWVIGISTDQQELLEPVHRIDQTALTTLDQLQRAQSATQSRMVMRSGIVAAVVAMLAGALAWLVSRSITGPIGRVVAGLTEGAEQVNAGASQVSQSAQELARHASEQAASLEETTSTLELLADAAQGNATNAAHANELAGGARGHVDASTHTMSELDDAMRGINESAGEIGKIIKVIQEIAFQTNLLALNAAVEAARAGEAGKGFAVVAAEVRNLAMRSADAAQDTTRLIEAAITRARQGTGVAARAGESLQSIATSVGQVAGLLDGISSASVEQSRSVEQIRTALNTIDQTTQANAAGAEESAAAAEELSSMSVSLKEKWLADLIGVMNGNRR